MIKNERFNIWIKNIIRSKNIYFIIGSIVIFYLINNFIWLKNNLYLSGPDEFHHLTISTEYYRLFATHFKGIFHNPLPHAWIWPPLYYIISVTFNLLFSPAYISSVMGNLFYLIILLFSIYFIGIKLFDKDTGILAVVFISMYPIVFRYSRYFNPEFGLMATVTLGICLLIYTDYFQNRKFSVLFGISFGLGMLTKWTFILFLIGPLIYVFLKSGFFRTKQNIFSKQKTLNFSFFLIPAILLPLFWYLSAPWNGLIQVFRSFLLLCTNYSYGEVESGFISQPLFHPEKLFGYLQLLIHPGISLLFFVIFILSLLPWIFKSKNKALLILWYIVPYSILSLSSHREGRFMLSALPAVALVSAAGLQAISFTKFRFLLRRDLYLIVILLGLLQFFDISYNYNPGRDYLRKAPIGIWGAPYSSSTEHHKWSYGPPYKKDWRMQKIAESIALHCRELPSLTIGIICYDAYAGEIFNYPFWLDYYLVKKDVNNAKVINLLFSRYQLAHFINQLEEINCIVFVSGDSPSPKFTNLKWQLIPLLNQELPNLQVKKEAPLEILRDFISNMESRFKLSDTIKLPEGYSAYIYKKN